MKHTIVDRPVQRSALRCLSLLVLALGPGCDGNGLATTPDVVVQTKASALESAQGDYYVVTRPDTRTCASPTCGGYFVKRANLAVTRCADSSQAADCHVYRLDFSLSGLTTAEGARFLQESFSTKTAVVKGALVRRFSDPLHPEDVLVVSEAWQGQARSVPKGFFSLVTPTGRLCTAYPCESYDGARLNGTVLRSLNGVNLAATGASADAVARGLQAMDGTGIIVAGTEAPVWDGTTLLETVINIEASEFYLRVSPCSAGDASGIGACGGRILGYKWDGLVCAPVSGCICLGRDCALLRSSLSACQNDHLACAGRGCGAGQPACGDKQFCDFPDRTAGCGVTGQIGQCRARPGICAGVFKPVCACDGKVYPSACEANVAGVDVLRDGACP